jgi:hypothetical protein
VYGSSRVIFKGKWMKKKKAIQHIYFNDIPKTKIEIKPIKKKSKANNNERQLPNKKGRLDIYG